MRISDLSIKYKPAIILKDSAKIELAYKYLIDIFSKSNYISGKDLLFKLNKICRAAETEALVLNLVDRQLVSKEGGKYSFENYIFNNACIDKIELDLEVQIRAAEIISLVQPAILKESNQVEIVATLPRKDDNFSPSLNVGSIYSEIQKMLSEAKKTIFIVNPFFDEESAEKIIPTLTTAAKEGVKIKLVVREASENNSMVASLEKIKKSFNEIKVSKNLSIRNYYKKERSGQIYATHAKIVIVDDKICYTGSANITYTSLYYNFEMGCILKGEKVKTVSDLLNILWSCSTEV